MFDCSPAAGTVAAFEFMERRHVPLVTLAFSYTIELCLRRL